MIRQRIADGNVAAAAERLDLPGTSQLVKRLRKHWPYYVFLIPAIAFVIIIQWAPLGGLVLMFKNYSMRKGIADSPWLDPWYDNFLRCFESPMFRRSLRNTISLSLKRIFIGFPCPIILALLFYELPFPRLKKATQTVSYLPYFLSWVILGGIIRNLLSPSTGAINAIVKAFGGEPIHFLARPEMFQGILVISGIWSSVGMSTVLYLAALSAVDKGMQEAARIDGASRFQTIWNVTIPCIMPVIVIQLILSMSSVMSGGFDQVFNLYNEAVMSTGDVIETYTYRVGLVDLDYSYSTTINFFQNVVSLIVVLLTNTIAKRVDPDNALF